MLQEIDYMNLLPREHGKYFYYKCKKNKKYYIIQAIFISNTYDSFELTIPAFLFCVNTETLDYNIMFESDFKNQVSKIYIQRLLDAIQKNVRNLKK